MFTNNDSLVPKNGIDWTDILLEELSIELSEELNKKMLEKLLKYGESKKIRYKRINRKTDTKLSE